MIENEVRRSGNSTPEVSLLSAIVRSEDAYYQAKDRLTPEMFERAINQRTYSVACELYGKGMDVNINLVAGELESYTDITIPEDYIFELFRNSYPINVEDAVQWMYNRYALKKLMGLIGGFAEYIDTQKDHQEAINYMVDALNNLRSGHVLRTHNIADVARDTMTEIHDAIGREVQLGTPVGFPTFDEKTGGLGPGHVVLMAGKAGTGKTTSSMTWCYNMSRAGMPVGFVSAEMSCRELSMLYLSFMSQVPTEKIRSGDLSADDIKRLDESIALIEKAPIYLIDKISDLMTAKGAITTLKAKYDVGFVVVDYIQTIGVPGMRSKTEAVGAVGSELTMHCKRLGVRALLLSQRSKDGGLKWSSDLENDADVICYIERPGNDDARYSKDSVILAVTKNRLGTETFEVHCKASERRIWEVSDIDDVKAPPLPAEEMEDLPF